MITEIDGVRFGVAPRDADWYFCAVIEIPGQDTDYVDGYAAGDRPTVSAWRELTACRHAYVGGMCYVSDEDLDTVSAERRARGLPPLECENCDHVYGAREIRPRVIEWKVRATPQGTARRHIAAGSDA